LTVNYKEVAMLVLNRKKHENIMIGSDIIVSVVEIMGDKVRLGITAPIEIPVHREEIYREIQQEKFGGTN